MKKDICNCGRAYLNPLSGICSLCWNEKFPNEKEEINEDDLLEPKQETLEEAAEKRIPTSTKVWDLTETRRNDFIAGAKWQAEKIPVDILKRIISFGDASPELMETPFIEIYEKSKRWLEQFKKK